VLYQLVQQHLATCLANACERSPNGFGLPTFVERTFEAFLECGIPALGFCRIRCDDCGHDTILPFSCKFRGLCPSCDGRRMADTAAHLVDRVLPPVSYRQFTLSFPRRVRFALARDGALLTKVLRAYLQVVFAWQRKRAREVSAGTPIPGAITAIQRAGGMANLNVHFHSIIPDGIFVRSVVDGAPPAFVALDPPTNDEVETMLLRIGRRVEKMLASHAADQADADADDDALVAAQRDAVSMPAAPWPRGQASATPTPTKPCCAFIEGYSLHAGVTVHENDRLGLERLCRYILRPAIATQRLELGEDGLVRYRFRRPDSAGRTHLSLAPEAFLARLATLIPPPRLNLLRYHGCFAPRSALRADIVPRVPKDTPRRLCCDRAPIKARDSELGGEASAERGEAPSPLPPDSDGAAPPESVDPADSPRSTQPAPARPPSDTSNPTGPRFPAAPDDSSALPATFLSRRLDWAGLLQRVFHIDVTRCARCGGRVRILAVLSHPDITGPILAHLGLDTQAPSIAPARAPPQLDFTDFA